MPPSDWMNDELKKMGEQWTVVESPKEQSGASTPRTYKTLDGVPTSPRRDAGTGGEAMVPGDTLGFNLHFRSSRPNSVQVLKPYLATYLEPAYDPETQRAMIKKFTGEIQEDKTQQRHKHVDARRCWIFDCLRCCR